MSFGAHLVEGGLLTEKGRFEARDLEQEINCSFLQAILKLGLMRERDLLQQAASYFALPLFETCGLTEPSINEVETALDRLSLSLEWASSRGTVLWLTRPAGPNNSAPPEPETLIVMTRDPLDTALREEIQRRWSGPTRLYLSPAYSIERLLSALVAQRGEAVEVIDDQDRATRLRELAEEAPVIDFVNRLFAQALELNASDIHIEPGSDGFETRLRIDGVLSHTQRHPKASFDPVCTRIKILSGMDIAERRLPQDGRQSIRVSGEEVDLRVSTLPATYGESIVMRLLRKKSELPDLRGVGLSEHDLSNFESLIGLPNGVILVTGPTGSGKSTTLYRALEQLNDGKRKIITIEDPVEYDIDGINQVQAHAEIGLTFASGLRSILRQDPDVIMVGEIRDQETALIAIQSALTGHLVFSTLHTNTALGAIERLQDLGVEPFLISASLRGVIGQRLLRRLCMHCRKPVEDPSEVNDLLARLARADSPIVTSLGIEFHEPVGCDHCSGSGYSGRIGVFEIINFNAIQQANPGLKVDEYSNKALLRSVGYTTMIEDGLIKASQGETSLEEIERVFGKAFDGSPL